MESIGVIGLGRFGKVLVNILEKGFEIKAFDINDINMDFSNLKLVDLKTVLKEKVVFIAIPIRKFETLISQIAPFCVEGQTIIDVCSVKLHPVKVMEKYLPQHTGIIATHPLFGPDSFTSYGQLQKVNKKLKIMMHPQRDHYKQFPIFKKFFQDQEIEVVEIDPITHDQMAAETQGLTHYLGRILKEFGVKKTLIDTQGYRELIELVQQTCNDSWELYMDLQQYNSFTKIMMEKITTSIQKLNQRAK